MEFQGVVSDPYFKPEAPRQNLLQSGSSMEEEEESDEEMNSDRDFGATLETLTNAYELQLKDIIQDLNLELERVSLSIDEAEEEEEERGEKENVERKSCGINGVVQGCQDSQVNLKSEGDDGKSEVKIVCNGDSPSNGDARVSLASPGEEDVEDDDEELWK